MSKKQLLIFSAMANYNAGKNVRNSAHVCYYAVNAQQ